MHAENFCTRTTLKSVTRDLALATSRATSTSGTDHDWQAYDPAYGTSVTGYVDAWHGRGPANDRGGFSRSVPDVDVTGVGHVLLRCGDPPRACLGCIKYPDISVKF